MTTLSLTEWQTSAGLDIAPPTVAVLRGVFKARVEPSTAGGELRWDVTPSGIVGAVRLGLDEVVVRPKIPIENVLHLLSVGSGRDPWVADDDARLATRSDVTAAVGALFAHLAQQALARGVLVGYREERADLATVRGRIDVANQLRRRPGLLLPLAVEYTEHDEDTLENRLLLAAATALRPLVAHAPDVARSLHRIRVILAEVSAVHVRPDRVPVVEWTRLNAHYRPAVELARVILARTGLDIDAGPAAALGITLNMAGVYELFLAAALGGALTGRSGSVRRQDPWFLDEDAAVRMEPDLVWYGSGGTARAVIDAKYKRLTGGAAVDADVYQLLAYCTALNLPEGHLVYAEGPTTVRPVRVVHGGPTIHAHALDLGQPPADLRREVAALADRIAGR